MKAKTSQSCCETENTRTQPRKRPAPDLELAALCKALGHSARVKIVRALLARDECVCGELVTMLPLAQSTVSQHLKVLKQAGLICGEVDGARSCYCANMPALARLKELVNEL